jgi:RNA polymerase sigma-70 factor (ECF subfamily)
VPSARVRPIPTAPCPPRSGGRTPSRGARRQVGRRVGRRSPGLPGFRRRSFHVVVVGKFGQVLPGEHKYSGEMTPRQGRGDLLLLTLSSTHIASVRVRGLNSPGGPDVKPRVGSGGRGTTSAGVKHHVSRANQGGTVRRATADSNDLDLRTEAGLRKAWVAHSTGLRAVARRSLHDRERAEDAVQETFLRAWRKAAHYDHTRGSIGSWLYAILRNLLVDIARSDASRPRTQPIVVDVVANDRLEELLGALTLERALRLLSVQHRQVIVESYVAQHPHDQIARRLGVPIGTVRSRLHYARAALGNALRDVGAIDASLSI